MTNRSSFPAFPSERRHRTPTTPPRAIGLWRATILTPCVFGTGHVAYPAAVGLPGIGPAGFPVPSQSRGDSGAVACCFIILLSWVCGNQNRRWCARHTLPIAAERRVNG